MYHKKLIANINRSISRKYSMGYFLLIGIAAILIAVSFIGSFFITSQNQKMMRELLVLNQLFIEVETVNTYVNDAYLYLRNSSRQNYTEYQDSVISALHEVRKSLNKEYSREIVDITCTVETYLEQSDALIKKLETYVTADKTQRDQSSLEEMYNQTQNTLHYINVSFKDVYSDKLITVQRVQEALKLWQSIIYIIQVTLLTAGSLICIIYYKKVLDGITKSIHKLTEFVGKIRNNLYQKEHVEISTGDEFGEFAEALNDMIDIIQDQVHEIEENSHIKEKLHEAEIENLRIYTELHKSQLILLQSRINPHFLFNTLNMISSTARLENAEQSANLMEITANYLRYNLDKLSKAVSLRDEIENVKDYVYLQKCRFEERFDFHFEVDPNCGGLILPCMILQPLVENSLRHGVNMMLKEGTIWIRAYREADRICLEVEDNGVGMEQQKIGELYRYLEDITIEDEHIGLKNIYMRLKIFFEDDVVFKIDSKEGKTLIHISLPNQERE
ncbi:MAG TPA: histidine kinase [Clostridiales bacterium]|nr:histidine kinase [Clostridiales bacterium]